jgi:N-acetylglucosaminyldiphosphoundecaprenol N-acetyl-beta-D-mannosaminyltransferase
MGMNNLFQFKKFKKNIDIVNIREKRKVVFMNPHSYVSIFKDRYFYNAIKNSTDIYIDGSGIYNLIKLKNFFLKKNLKYNRVTGYDYFNYAIKNLYNKNILLIGSTNKNLQLIKKRILIKNPSCKVYLLNAPFVKKDFTKRHVQNIFQYFKIKEIDICFVSAGAPKQEKLAELISNEMPKKGINIKVIASVGAVFDYYSKNLSFLFYLSRKIYLEWLYRLLNNLKLWPRTFISAPIFLILYLISAKPDYKDLKAAKDINKLISTKKKFILSAFNLSCYAYIFQNKINISEDIYFWQDGVISKFFFKKFKKLPGRNLIANLKIPKNIKSIFVIGNLKSTTRFFLERKYKVPIKHMELPFGNIKKILKHAPKTHSSELILITLPTPKQEIMADYIFKKNINTKIICIGGGLAIASKDEKPCPKFMEIFYLEFLWRLQYQTKRRSIRLVHTLYLFFKSIFFLFHKRIIINEK